MRTVEPEILGLPAADLPATREALLRARRRVVTLLAVGAVGLVGFVVSVTVIGNASDALRAHGSRAIGTVSTLYPDSRYGDGHADIRFTAEGHERVETVDLGSDADYYSEGQKVTVYYDPADPSRMTIDDEDNQPVWTVWPMCIALVVGFFGLGAAPFLEWRRRRMRRLLESGPWRPVRVFIRQGDKRILFTTADLETWRSRTGMRWPDTDEEPPTVPADQPAWWVTNGDRAVFSPDRGHPLLLARRERGRRRDGG